MLYLFSVIVIVLIYFMFIMLFSNIFPIVIVGIISLIIGIALVFKRDKLVLTISNKLQERKIKEHKKANKHGLHSTLRKITPKRKKKINVTPRASVKDHINHLKGKLSKKKKGKDDYIELK